MKKFEIGDLVVVFPIENSLENLTGRIGIVKKPTRVISHDCYAVSFGDKDSCGEYGYIMNENELMLVYRNDYMWIINVLRT